MMESIWMKDYIDKNLPKVTKNINTPILIIGGGITGLMCAYNLMKKNINFILVDSKKLASKVSAYTTAQISIAHDSLYDDIMTKHNDKKAIAYLKSQMEGLDIIKEIIKTEKIDCDSKEESTILHANLNENIKVLKRQFKLIKKYNDNCELLPSNKNSIDFKKGIEFKNQLIINPVKYMMSIIDILIEKNIALYEKSLVTKIRKKDMNYEIVINDKHIITAKKIIMACHYPFLNPDNLYFAKIYQSKSYAIAFETKLKLKANYVSLDQPYYYVRTYDDSTLIIGGSDHFTGINNDINQCYQTLINKIYQFDKGAKIKYKWVTEDCMSIDSLPFVGHYSNRNPNILIATGFQKWGFTNSHIAAKNITNILINKEYDLLYKPKRWTFVKDIKSTFRMVSHSINGLIVSKLFVKKYEIDKIKIGSGKVMKYKNLNVLVYREKENKYVFLKNKCTHMGCSLIWNDVDKVWESKCHGSIFDQYGRVIYGPALKNLERLDL